MNIEELAEMFDGDCQFCAYDGQDCSYNDKMYCDEGCLKWLDS